MALDSLDYIRVKPALNAEMLRKYIYISLLFISFSNFNVIKQVICLNLLGSWEN